MERVFCFLIGYAFGNFPTGYLYAKLHGVDITKKGSGNVGTTNVLRNLGVKAGLITMLGDFLKTFLPLFLTAWLYRDQADMRYLLTVYTGFGAIIGHNFPLTLKLHGGKGVACTAAMIIYSDPLLLLVEFVLFVGTVAVSRFVSLGSLVAGIGYFVLNLLLVSSGRPMGWGGAETLGVQYHTELYVLVFLVSAMIVFQHRSNIGRLLKGKENKLSFHRQKA